MHFVKMQGAGNDYVYIDCFDQTVENPKELAAAVSNRHFGIGSDGLILICPSEHSDCRMEMYNADGSLGKMCGNGIRCVAEYLRTVRKLDRMEYHIDTDSGEKTVRKAEKYDSMQQGKLCTVEKGNFYSVQMGKAEFVDERIPEVEKIPGFLHYNMVDIGNKHLTVFVKKMDRISIKKWGEKLGKTEQLSNEYNIEFAEIINSGIISMRVFERGSGETLSCGTGSCAAAAAYKKWKRIDHTIEVKQKGGSLWVTQNPDGSLVLTGKAEIVYLGEWLK